MPFHDHPPADVGPAGDAPTTRRAQHALGDLHDALVSARCELTEARDVEWVSSAAGSYRRLLDETLGDMERISRALADATDVVLRHTAAADAAQRAPGAVCGPYDVLFTWKP